MSARTLAAGLLLGLLAATSSAQDQPDERLAAMNRFYAGLDTLGATLVQELRLPAFPMADSDITHAFRLQRDPGHLALRHTAGRPGGSVVLHGEQLMVSFDMTRTYARGEVRGGLDAVFDDTRVSGLPVPGLFLARALVEGPVIAVDSEASVREVGRELVGETAARHLRVDGEQSLDVWIAEGPKPWLLKVVPQPPGEEDLPEGMDGGMVAQVTFLFRDWDAAPELEGAFSLTPPKGFAEADSVLPELPGMGAPSDGPGGPRAGPGGHGPGADHASLGEPAPEVTLEGLDGSTVALSELRGEIVVLDFWATWCKPCLMGLPTVKQVTGEYAERGVVFHAVDVGEKPKRIQALLDKRGWELPVALDLDRSIAKAFGVGPIPHTVILDARGRVARVHVGFSTTLEQTLRADLEALLAERDEP